MQIQLKIYQKKKIYVVGKLAAESAKLQYQARFLTEISEK